MDPARNSELMASPERRRQIAKEWLLRIVESTPVDEIPALPLARVIEEGPGLIAETLDALARPLDGPRPGSEERARRLASLREASPAPARVAADLGALHSVVLEALRVELGAADRVAFGHAAERLALVFGGLQAEVAGALAAPGAREDDVDPLTGLPGASRLEQRLREAQAEFRRYGHPFALGLIDLEGLGRVNDAYGRDAGDRMLSAVAAVIRRYVRAVDQPFRLGGGEFGVLAPHQRAGGLVPAAERIAAMISSAEPEQGPRVAITAGIASCPDDGEALASIREAAEQALFEAKAAGHRVAIGRNGTASGLQDR